MMTGSHNNVLVTLDYNNFRNLHTGTYNLYVALTQNTYEDV